MNRRLNAGLLALILSAGGAQALGTPQQPHRTAAVAAGSSEDGSASPPPHCHPTSTACEPEDDAPVNGGGHPPIVGIIQGH